MPRGKKQIGRVDMDTTPVEKKGILASLLSILGLSPVGILALAVLAVLPLVLPSNQEYVVRWLIAGAVLASLGIAFDFTDGYINVVNFGMAAFLGVGGYTSALVSIHLDVPIWVGMIAGCMCSGILGLLTGLLTLRLRGVFALCMTWFLSLALMGLATKLVKITRGPLGLACPKLFSTTSNTPYFYVIIGIMIAIYVVSRAIVRSPMGLAFKAIGQNIEAARTSGINPTKYRVINFTISCAFAGCVGGFYAHYYGILTPEVMGATKTTEVLVVVYIGGRASLWGEMLAAFLFVFLMEFMRSYLSGLPGVNLVIYGLFLILVMIYYPGGVSQFYSYVKSKVAFERGSWKKALYRLKSHGRRQ